MQNKGWDKLGEIKEMKYYIFEDGKEPAGWEDRYIEFLNFLKQNQDMLLSMWGEYEDPDSIVSPKGEKRPKFYEDLCDFLNNQENALTKKLNGRFRYENDEKNGIKVYKTNEEVPFTYLKSDQFGFSAPRIELNHIYDVYLMNGGNSKNVAKWIKNSRTLGGSFLWPMEKKGEGFSKNPEINFKRGGFLGGGSYIQDRVDLTLQEIKDSYAGEDNIIGGLAKKCPNLKIWLEHFGGFETFVDFFKFDDFIAKGPDGYEPIWITKEKNIYSKEMTEEKIEQMLEKLCGDDGLIIKRTKRMLSA